MQTFLCLVMLDLSPVPYMQPSLGHWCVDTLEEGKGGGVPKILTFLFCFVVEMLFCGKRCCQGMSQSPTLKKFSGLT